TFGKKEEQIFLGREISQHRDYSEATAIQIDEEVRKVVSTGYATAKRILSENRETLIRIAKALIEREVLDATEIKLLVEGQELPPIKPLPAKADDGVQQVLKPERAPAKGGQWPANRYRWAAGFGRPFPFCSTSATTAKIFRGPLATGHYSLVTASGVRYSYAL